MYEKRRYGTLVLHRVTESKSNEQAKADAADVRSEGYRARIDTWQGGFAVWSDKGLSDPTMPKKSSGAPTVRRGRRAGKPTIQRAYDEFCKTQNIPPKKFKHEKRVWHYKEQVWSAEAQKRLRESHAKKGFDSVVLNFKGRGYILYIAKWEKKLSKPKHEIEDYLRASGHGKIRPSGVTGTLRGKTAPKTLTHQNKKWTRFACHLSLPQAKNEAGDISEEFHVKLFETGVGTVCIYIRAKSRRKLPKKTTVRLEVFAYLDRLHKAGVDRERMSPILVEMYGMADISARNFVSNWAGERRLDEKPATHPGRKQVSKGVYMTKAEVPKDKAKSRPSAPRSRQIKLLDGSVIGTKSGMADRAESILGVQVDEVYAARQFGKKDLLLMIRSGNVIKIYESLRGRTKGTKNRFVERRLVDKFSATTSQAGREKAFRRELSRRGIQ